MVRSLPGRSRFDVQRAARLVGATGEALNREQQLLTPREAGQFTFRLVEGGRAGPNSTSHLPQPQIAQPMFDIGKAQCNKVAIKRA